MTCFWKDIESDISAHTLTCTHTWRCTHTHAHTFTWRLRTCAHAHRYMRQWHILMHIRTYTHYKLTLMHTGTQCDMHTYTLWMCTSHTHTHTYIHAHAACKSDNFEKSVLFLHTASILVSVQQRRESRLWPTLRWCNSVNVGKMVLNYLPCYFQKLSIRLRGHLQSYSVSKPFKGLNFSK